MGRSLGFYDVTVAGLRYVFVFDALGGAGGDADSCVLEYVSGVSTVGLFEPLSPESSKRTDPRPELSFFVVFGCAYGDGDSEYVFRSFREFGRDF